MKFLVLNPQSRAVDSDDVEEDEASEIVGKEKTEETEEGFQARNWVSEEADGRSSRERGDLSMRPAEGAGEGSGGDGQGRR